MTTGDWASSHASATCCGADAACGGDLGEGGVLVGELLGVAEATERAPREEGEAELLADVDLGAAAAEGRAELVLDAHEGVAEHGVGGADLLGVRVGEADHGDLAAVGDLLEGADDLVVGHVRVGAVVLPQRELLDAEALEAGVDGTVQVLGGAVEVPAAALGAHVPALGGEEDTVAHPELVEDRGDEPLVLALRVGALLVARPVGVGGVEEGDAGVERGASRCRAAAVAAGSRSGRRSSGPGRWRRPAWSRGCVCACRPT